MNKNESPIIWTIEELTIGQEFSFETQFTLDDVKLFAKLTGDLNPIHIDPEYASRTSMKNNIVHGQLVAGLFSRIVGMHCPGLNSLYLAQTTQFRAPVYVNDSVKIVAVVTAIHPSVKLVTLKTRAWVLDRLCVDGEAKAQFRDISRS